MNEIRYIVAAHGSSSEEANEAIRLLAGSLGPQLGSPVTAAFLERAEPSIPAALANASAAGAQRIVLIPFFLMPGTHVRRDITGIVAQARARNGTDIVVTEFLGGHREIPSLLVDLAKRALVRTNA